MANAYCSLLLMFIVLAAMIALGLINIFKKDQAWLIQEWLLRRVKPQRTPEWEYDATIRGVIMVMFGILWLVFILYFIL